MKAATGELQLTVITMIAIAAIIGFFWAFWPKIQESINSQWDTIKNPNGSSSNPSTGYIIRK